MFDMLHEECGVFGVWSPERTDVAEMVYYGLYALQHRGQESCGIALSDDGVFRQHRADGLVGDVFNRAALEELGQGSIAVGHVRYSTTGGKNPNNIQPVVVCHIKGNMALCHNGNLVNANSLRSEHEMRGGIFHGTTDTESIAYTIVSERLRAPSTEEAVAQAMPRIQGAYACVLMTATKLIAFRDKNGFRPLCYGQTAEGAYVVASESCALSAVGARFIREVEPGEVLIIGADGVRSDRRHCGRAASLCLFEYIYFARPDSVIGGASVYAARKRAGMYLAKASPAKADVVIGVPDSGLDAAIGFSQESGIPYGVGFVKNRYVGRSYIAPNQRMRENAVRIKLNVIADTVRDKRVVLIDDSIVRGTTSARIVGLLREAGAREVHMRISSPPFRHPCYFGTDVDSQENLIACRLPDVEAIARYIGADSLAYLSVQDAHRLAGDEGCRFCDGCFTGQYPIPIPEEQGKNKFEQPLTRRSSK
ncbi:MAG: amidophosphoribosyltransferase [Clostridiales bacterium]|nr:amidophosphoribosyltransferase [Clostridiales bacterium]